MNNLRLLSSLIQQPQQPLLHPVLYHHLQQHPLWQPHMEADENRLNLKKRTVGHLYNIRISDYIAIIKILNR